MEGGRGDDAPTSGARTPAIWLLELLYLGIMTGDPFYRFNIALNYDSTIDRTIDLAGNGIVNPLVDPILVMLNL